MTAPGLPDLPPNALDDARTLLHVVLGDVLEAVGWHRDRADRYPLVTPKVPGAWVDVPTLSRQGQGLVATFPLGIAVDGNEAVQVSRLDALLALLWSRLEAVRVPDDAERLPRQSLLDVMTGGPEQLDVGGPTTRSVALTVQVPISPRSLCPTPITTTPNGDPAP